jgi:hypothetical protein
MYKSNQEGDWSQNEWTGERHGQEESEQEQKRRDRWRRRRALTEAQLLVPETVYMG